MNLSQERFRITQFNYADENNQFRSIPQFTYETNNALYDLIILQNKQYVRTNCGPWSNTINSWNKVHYELLNHFKKELECWNRFSKLF